MRIAVRQYTHGDASDIREEEETAAAAAATAAAAAAGAAPADAVVEGKRVAALKRLSAVHGVPSDASISRLPANAS